MTFESIYCHHCRRCYPRIGSGNMVLIPCGHPVGQMVRVDREVVGRHERVKLWRRGKWPIWFWLRPDGNGGRYIEYKPGKAKNPRLYSVPAFVAWLEAKVPALAEAFEARRDVRRGVIRQ
jgi:hypothetical protein